MSRIHALAAAVSLVASIATLSLAILPGCRSAPITGRRQLLMVPESSEVSMGITAYQETVSSQPVSTNAQYIALVERVGHRIAQVANRPDYDWEFRVIASPEMNAFCLPGGKVAVYEGILPVCQNEAGVAVVLSHEIAHALARHGGERMSHSYVVNGLGTAVGYMTRNQEAVLRDRVNTVYGLSSKYGFILPYSRKHESEADHMGILLMAQAGYDPSEAPRFWTRFGAGQQGAKPPEFFSTHPADEHRAAALQELLPQAMAMYQQAPQQFGLGEPLVAPAPLAQTTPAE
jgi:predicted Zn-dependent protease